MFSVAFILINVHLAQSGHSLDFYPLLAPSGSPFCAGSKSSYVLDTDDVVGVPPGVPGLVRCALHCVGMNSKITCSGFNYLDRGSTSGTCQFYSQPPTDCTAMVKGCMYYEVSSSNQPPACKPRFVHVCDSSPCLNNGTCVESDSGFNCTCLSGLTGSIAGFEGTRCEILVTNIINLPATYNYIRVSGVSLSNKSAILVYAKGAVTDVNVGFTQYQVDYTANTMYEILIGGWSNTKSVIRKGMQGSNLVTVSTPSILSATSYRPFWVTWAKGVITVGKGTTIGNNTFMVYNDPTPSVVNFLALAGWTTASGSAYIKVLP